MTAVCFMWALHLTTKDAGQFVQVMVPVMHAQQTQARGVCICCHHHLNAPYNATKVTLLLAKVIVSLLRLLNGQVRQLQTNNHRQSTCNTRLAHTQLP